MDVLSHPFRFAPTGQAATVAEGSTEANAEAVAVLALTRKGERPLVPDFGITDPVFADLDPAELGAGVALFGPEGVTIASVSVEYPTAVSASVLIEFEETP